MKLISKLCEIEQQIKCFYAMKRGDMIISQRFLPISVTLLFFEFCEEDCMPSIKDEEQWNCENYVLYNQEKVRSLPEGRRMEERIYISRDCIWHISCIFHWKPDTLKLMVLLTETHTQIIGEWYCNVFQICLEAINKTCMLYKIIMCSHYSSKYTSLVHGIWKQ